MNHLSLFNGIGGFQLAASWVGWNNVAHVEIDEWCNKVVKKHFPESECFTDIKQFDGTEFKGAIDIISGGFPCQPFSTAGKRKGTSDDRYLWPEMLRIIREIKPSFIVGENVAGLISMEGGKTLKGILTDLDDEGYQTESFIIPACGVGAWHRRERIWIVCHSRQINSNARRIEWGRNKESSQGQQYTSRGQSFSESNSLHNTIPNPEQQGLEGYNEYRSEQHRENKGIQSGAKDSGTKNKRIASDSRLQRQEVGQEQTTRIEQCNKGDDSNPLNTSSTRHGEDSRHLPGITEPERFDYSGEKWWTTEPSVGRVANGIPDRIHRLKGLGNAIVPQVAF